MVYTRRYAIITNVETLLIEIWANKIMAYNEIKKEDTNGPAKESFGDPLEN